MEKYYLFLYNVNFIFGIYTNNTIISTVRFIKFIYTIKCLIVLNFFNLFFPSVTTSNLKMEIPFSDYLIVI